MSKRIAVTVNGRYVIALYAVRNAGWEVCYGEAVQAETFPVAELSRAVADIRSAVGAQATIKVVPLK